MNKNKENSKDQTEATVLNPVQKIVRRLPKGVEKLECELIDINGNIVQIGDEIIVKLPELYFESEYSEPYYRSAKELRVKLLLYLSQGLRLRVIEIIDPGEEDDSCFQKGTVLCFRRTVWEWHKAV